MLNTSSYYNVQVLVDGKPIKEYTKDGKIFVEAKSGSEYSIRLKNSSTKRALAVISIDSINIITGEVAKPTDTGYIVNAGSSVEIKGYRQDQAGGGRFKFTEKESGYSKEIDGSGINSGVIGVRFIAEQGERYTLNVINPTTDWYEKKPASPENPAWYSDYTLNSSRKLSSSIGSSEPYSRVLRSCASGQSKSVEPVANSSINFCSVTDWHEQPTYTSTSYTTPVQSEAPVFDRATTWGSKYEEKITYVDFNRSTESVIHNIYYASRESLKKQNIIKETPPQVFPESFPTFAKPPKNWNQ